MTDKTANTQTGKPKWIWIQAADMLKSSLNYLHHSWGIDTPRDQMQANIDARAILIRCITQIIDEAELEVMLNNRVLCGDFRGEQAIPSPEDRVRAMTAEHLLLRLACSGDTERGNRHIWEETRAELLSRLSLVEELKGQVVSASPQPAQDQVTTFFLNRYGIDLQSDMWNGQNMVMFALAVCKEFFASAPAEARKRKDYHAEYVEAVEAAEKAQRELGVMREALRPFTECQPPYDHDNECSFCMTPEGQEHPPECSWMIARAALTPEPASQAAEEKK